VIATLITVSWPEFVLHLTWTALWHEPRLHLLLKHGTLILKNSNKLLLSLWHWL
jgi:hypothetical protein